MPTALTRQELQVKAWRTFGKARRDGLEKPTHCSKCKQAYPSKQIHAHHPDYHKPLKIVWLCYRCHKNFEKTVEFFKRSSAFWEYCRDQKIDMEEAINLPLRHKRTGAIIKQTVYTWWRSNIWSKQRYGKAFRPKELR